MTPIPPWCMTFGSNFSTTAGVLMSKRAGEPVAGTAVTPLPLRAR